MRRCCLRCAERRWLHGACRTTMPLKDIPPLLHAAPPLYQLMQALTLATLTAIHYQEAGQRQPARGGFLLVGTTPTAGAVLNVCGR